jgi:hypothetical protein
VQGADGPEAQNTGEARDTPEARVEHPGDGTGRQDPDKVRRTTGVLTVMAAATLTASLAGCANGNAQALAREACTHVARSLAMYHNAEEKPGSARAASEEGQASAQLSTALPLAAKAAGEAPQWQALMADLLESTRLPESNLAHALEAQCAAADTNGVAPPATAATAVP